MMINMTMIVVMFQIIDGDGRHAVVLHEVNIIIKMKLSSCSFSC